MVSMEPRIGIQGKAQVIRNQGPGFNVSMEPRIGIQGKGPLTDMPCSDSAVSMEPRIGIQGKLRPTIDVDLLLKVSMEPRIGIQGKQNSEDVMKRALTSFNGAPDRNPGKEVALVGIVYNEHD